jgi:glycosyltransferase involved in cell wall biosynthesis
MTITITAVIPTFDRPELLVKAVASVLGQSSPADEVIVVDNGDHRGVGRIFFPSP